MTNDERAMLRALCRGRTQGVGFRAFVRDRARKLALTGFVHNQPDGASVEVVAEGPQSALDALLVMLREGPAMAKVDRVDASWGVATGEYAAFEVR